MNFKQELLSLENKKTGIVKQFRKAMRKRETQRMDELEKEFDEVNREIKKLTSRKFNH